MTYRTDADAIWLDKELRKIETKVFEKQYADLTYAQLLPVDTSTVGPADDTYVYRVMDRVGKFKVIQDRASDLPRVDITRKEVTHKVVSIGASYGYTIKEVLAAQRENLPLEASRISAVRRAYEEKVQDIAYFGDSSVGITGFFNNPDVDSLNITGSWFSPTATPDDMLAILNAAVRYMVKSSNMVEMPNTMLLAYEDHAILNETPRSSTSDTTVLEYFLRNDRYISSIIPMNELDGMAGSGKNRMVLYNRNPEKLKLHIPQVLQSMPAQRFKLEYEVACHARVMGTTTYYPKSVLYVNEV